MGNVAFQLIHIYNRKITKTIQKTTWINSAPFTMWQAERWQIKKLQEQKFATNARKITNHKNLLETFTWIGPKSFCTLYSSDISPSSSSFKNSICSTFALHWSIHYWSILHKMPNSCSSHGPSQTLTLEPCLIKIILMQANMVFGGLSSTRSLPCE